MTEIELEFRAAMGLIALILAACSIAANFMLIDMYYTRMEQKAAMLDARRWRQNQKKKIARIEKRMERHRRETISRWMKDVKGAEEWRRS